MSWELVVAENYGEMPKDQVKDNVVGMSVDSLNRDALTALTFVPNTLNYVIGWRAIVWKNQETGALKELTEEEFKQYTDGNAIRYNRGDSSSAGGTEPAAGDEGQISEPTA